MMVGLSPALTPLLLCIKEGLSPGLSPVLPRPLLLCIWVEGDGRGA